MECKQAILLLDDYHYGELDPGEAAAVETHLRGCHACRKELDSLEREAKAFGAYAAQTERGLDLSPDLWKRALEASARKATVQPPRPWWFRSVIPAASWARQAIAATLLVALSITGTLLIVHQRDRAIPQVAVGGQGMDRGLDAALKSIQKAEQEYLRAIQQLNALVDKQKSTLDPRVVAELQTSLRLVDEHIAATRQAYYAHPEDAELALFMLAAYSRKVELLQDLTS